MKSNVRILREHPPLRSPGTDGDGDDDIPPAYFVDDYDSEDDPAFVEQSKNKLAASASKQKSNAKKKAKKDDVYDVMNTAPSPDPHPFAKNLRIRQAPMRANMKTRSHADNSDDEQPKVATKAPKKDRAATSAVDKKGTSTLHTPSSIPANKSDTTTVTSRLPSYRHTPYGTIASKSTMLKAYYKETKDASFGDIGSGRDKKKDKLAPPVGDDDEEELLWFD
ncbi:hypothetical protein K4K54_001181 [Colletotrichum sp. SAR 10_86]|nr:hypothetical protein K4K54_001181 [Colletotrichum sp. SAR 10_86]KAI8250910.1 hypothetical protein K4K58_009324 [Colletotrichum sp. SAR11_239]